VADRESFLSLECGVAELMESKAYLLLRR
jgi:hypothetical protein